MAVAFDKVKDPEVPQKAYSVVANNWILNSLTRMNKELNANFHP